MERLVYWCRGVAFFEVLEFAGRASVLVALIVWVLEADDRRKQKHYRAWEVINSTRGLSSDGGRRDALQDLNEDRVNLSAAPLAEAYLIKVQLPKAILTGADLTLANLAAVNLTEARLTKASLNRANLAEANLSAADLSGANLTAANLFKAIGDQRYETITLSWASISKIFQSKSVMTEVGPLPDALLTEDEVAQLRTKVIGVNLAGASMVLANLAEARLTRANLSATELTGANLSSAELNEANLSGANMLGTNLFLTNLAGANLSGANMLGANLTKAFLDGADLIGTKFCLTTMPDGTVNNRDCEELTSPDPSETPPAPN